MKQLHYTVAIIIVLFFAVSLMSKVKDVPEEEFEPEHLENDDEIEEEENENMNNPQ